jgi:hypothetical protein
MLNQSQDLQHQATLTAAHSSVAQPKLNNNSFVAVEQQFSDDPFHMREIEFNHERFEGSQCPNASKESHKEKFARSLCRSYALFLRYEDKNALSAEFQLWNSLNPMKTQREYCRMLAWRRTSCFSN